LSPERKTRYAITLNMDNVSLNDPVLDHFRAAVDEVYGGRVEHVVLFGRGSCLAVLG
jgi:hypothetical protein